MHHGSRQQPHNDSFCGKASFCSTFLQRNRSSDHKTNAGPVCKERFIASPEQPMPVLLRGHFVFLWFYSTTDNAHNCLYFQQKQVCLFIKVNPLPTLYRIRYFLHRGSLKSVSAAQASIALDYCNTEAKMYQSNQKNQRITSAVYKGFGIQKYLNDSAFFRQPFTNAVSESSAVERMRTQPASRQE